MRPSQDYLLHKFDEYNALIFKGELPRVPIILSNAKGYIGILRYKRRRRGLFGGEQLYDFRIFISTRLDLPEQEVQDTLIHEMIHYYIGLKGIRDTSAHGRVFRQLMNDINSRYDRHISISHKSNPLQREEAADKSPKFHAVAFVELKDGRFGIRVLPRIVQRILEYDWGLRHSGQVRSIVYYLTVDPYFNRFPSSAALKVFFVPSEEAHAHLGGASRIIIKAGRVTFEPLEADSGAGAYSDVLQGDA